MKMFIVIILGLCLIGIFAGYRHGYRTEEAAIALEAQSRSFRESVNPSTRALSAERHTRESRLKPDEIIETLLTIAETRDRKALKKLWASIGDYSATELAELFELTAGLQDSEMRDFLYERVMSAWALLDREDAFFHASSLSLEEDREDAIDGLFRGLAGSDPMDAFAFWKVVGTRTGEVYWNTKVLRGIFQEWGRTDLEGGFSAYKELEAGSCQRRAS